MTTGPANHAVFNSFGVRFGVRDMKSLMQTLNLRNRMIFPSADEAEAVQAADFLGKKQVVKRSWGSSAGKRSVNYSETEEHKIKPHKLRNLRNQECVLVH